VPGTLIDAEGRIACGGGALHLLEVQPAGKSAMSAVDFLRGARLVPGDRLA
jgi:methionyl-tRNA formyltransferase